jgi:hypothetical protein
MNRGALLLAEIIRNDKNQTCAAIGRKVGASESHVYRMSMGERVPHDRSHAIAMRDHYGIPVDAWDEVIADTDPAPPPSGPAADLDDSTATAKRSELSSTGTAG